MSSSDGKAAAPMEQNHSFNSTQFQPLASPAFNVAASWRQPKIISRECSDKIVLTEPRLHDVPSLRTTTRPVASRTTREDRSSKPNRPKRQRGQGVISNEAVLVPAFTVVFKPLVLPSRYFSGMFAGFAGGGAGFVASTGTSTDSGVIKTL